MCINAPRTAYRYTTKNEVVAGFLERAMSNAFRADLWTAKTLKRKKAEQIIIFFSFNSFFDNIFLKTWKQTCLPIKD